MQCQNCGAALDAADGGHTSVRCHYCGVVNEVVARAVPNQGAVVLDVGALLAGQVTPNEVQALLHGGASTVQRIETTSYTVNGVTYRSLDEMPPDVRRTIEQSFAMLAAMPGTSKRDPTMSVDGAPMVLETSSNVVLSSVDNVTFPASSSRSSGGGAMVVIAVAVVIGVVAIVVGVAFLLASAR